MGELTDVKKKFTIRDDGTIVRGKKCPNCGMELLSEGTYCEYCGAKIIKDMPSNNGNFIPLFVDIMWVVFLLVAIMAYLSLYYYCCG